MRAAVIFDNFGPYHLARVKAAARVCELTAVQVGARSAEYAWECEACADGFKLITLFTEGASRDGQRRELIHKLEAALTAAQPEVVFIPGWSGRAAFAALRWCARNKIPAVAMSESTAWDEPRSAWREAVKRRIVGLYAVALAGGRLHKDYLMKLGLPAGRISLGYDAVDNRHFEGQAAEARSQKSEAGSKQGLPENYFLASARFIRKKNLPRLVEAYSRYRQLASKSETGNRKPEIWHLVLLGDGALRSSILNLRSSLGLDACVHLPGFKQYPELPAYYGLARAFIHASTTEPWGLVVNEAMASGLPVLVSNRCGCAADLVQEGVNGFTFEPDNIEQLAGLMLRISDFRFPISDFGAASARIIAGWGPERFAQGFKAAAETALAVGARPASWFDRLLLEGLLRR